MSDVKRLLDERTVGRIRKDGGWDRRYRQAVPDPEPEPVNWVGIAMAIAIILVWFGAIFWAMPVLLTAAQR